MGSNRSLALGRTLAIGERVKIRLVAVYGSTATLEIECPDNYAILSVEMPEVSGKDPNDRDQHFKKLARNLFKI